MDTHPFTSWDSATVIYTFADSPVMVQLLFWLSVVVTAGVIVASARHEKHAMARLEKEEGE